MPFFEISGQIVDLIKKRIFPGTLRVGNGKIISIHSEEQAPSHYILPGFVDSHIHIESSMLIPSEFARLATVHGTVATISDPHEIANVLGIAGTRYMIQNGSQVPFHFYFGASPCVPATTFETAGATLTPEDIRSLFEEDGLHYLSEMMNFPGVLHKDPIVMEKIRIAKELGKPVDGHAPGLRGAEAKQYIEAGISTDHECFTLEEALEKISYGMKILIREGSAAKNYEALHPLIARYPGKVMFCSDDKHPHELVEGHINTIVSRSIIEKGYDTFDVLRCASVLPIEHYNLNVGLLQPGDNADFIVVDNLKEFNVQRTYIKGQLVAKEGLPLIESVQAPIVNHFYCSHKNPQDFMLVAEPGQLKVIKVIEGQLVTDCIHMDAKIENGSFVSDPSRDLLKIAVVNRYSDQPLSIGFIHQFGLKRGAIASCVAHDSHNIICVGTNDEDMCQAVNAIIDNQGGISAACHNQVQVLPLPIAGIMSQKEGYQLAKDYIKIDQFAKSLGTPLQAPFMTLSFMALLVIPTLKLSDKGLFDGKSFQFTSLTSTE